MENNESLSNSGRRSYYPWCKIFFDFLTLTLRDAVESVFFFYPPYLNKNFSDKLYNELKKQKDTKLSGDYKEQSVYCFSFYIFDIYVFIKSTSIILLRRSLGLSFVIMMLPLKNIGHINLFSKCFWVFITCWALY